MTERLDNKAFRVPILPCLAAFGLLALAAQFLSRHDVKHELIVGLGIGTGLILHYFWVERVRARERERMLTLLRTLNGGGNLRETIQQVTAFMRDWTDCSAVGVRLRDGEDYPYYETRGFAPAFVKVESRLCAFDEQGCVLRDAAGNPCLACMCGNVIAGRFDPSQPFFTKKGSFWTNSTSKLLAHTGEAQRQGRTRNRCNGEGYESVALVPLRADGQTFGLLQFNDRAKGRFSPRTLVFLEEMADVIALSLGQRRAQDLLARSEIKFRQVVETAIEGIWMVDADQKTIWVNPRCAEILGSTADEMIGRSFEEFFFPEDLPAHRQRMAERRAGKNERYEVRYRRPDGSEVWCYVAPWGTFDDEGRFTGSFAMVSDISERKRAEAEQEALRAQLLQAQKMESVGRLAGAIAHDFNNMLSVINGHAELALQELDATNPLYADLFDILSAGRRSATLTRQLLAFARQQSIQPQIIDLNRAVASMLKMLRRLIGEDIELTWAPHPGLWSVYMDPAQVDQVLANLTVNARDALAGGGAIRIETSNEHVERSSADGESGRGDYVRLRVRDTGCGMDDATLAKAFEPFFTTKQMGQGTGLGLSTVYGVVKQNHGFVQVDSSPGKGTTFDVYLPRSYGHPSVSGESVAIADMPGGTETILVVEDEESVLRMVRGVLGELGYRVLAAVSSEAALQLAAEQADPIHLVVTDLVLPGMSGPALVQKLTASRPSLKCLYISGYPSEVLASHGLGAADLRLLQKPFTMSALAQMVRNAIDARSSGAC
jgi:PAS domain S-box-containing protein